MKLQSQCTARSIDATPARDGWPCILLEHGPDQPHHFVPPQSPAWVNGQVSTLDELEQEIASAIELIASTAAVDRPKAARLFCVEFGSRILKRMTGELERIVAEIAQAGERLEQLRAMGDRVELGRLAAKLEIARADARELLALHESCAALIEGVARGMSDAVGEWLDARELDEKKEDPKL